MNSLIKTTNKIESTKWNLLKTPELLSIYKKLYKICYDIHNNNNISINIQLDDFKRYPVKNLNEFLPKNPAFMSANILQNIQANFVYYYLSHF